MPGVPSGRACEACRRLKKKCDEVKPTCGRCTRLQIPCIGSGERRFKFQNQEQETFLQSSSSQKLVRRSRSKSNEQSASEASPGSPVAIPGNESTWLVSALAYTIGPKTGIRYNLAWAYGPFMDEIPRRLGTNKALDAAADAVVTLHMSYSLRRDVSVVALSKYSRAMSLLRECLDDPVKAGSADTLCVVMLLMICQSFTGVNGRRFSGHAEGAAQILKARKSLGPRDDDFEKKILLSLRGPVLFEGLFNPKIILTSEEWKELIENEFDQTTVEGRMLRMFAQLPALMQQGRNIFKEADPSTLNIAAEIAAISAGQELLNKTKALHDACVEIYKELRDRYLVIPAPDPNATIKVQAPHGFFQRSYGLALLIIAIVNVVLRGMIIARRYQKRRFEMIHGEGSASSILVDPDRPPDGEIDPDPDATLAKSLIRDAEQYARETIQLAKEGELYRPLGSMYMVACLFAAWAGVAMGDSAEYGPDQEPQTSTAAEDLTPATVNPADLISTSNSTSNSTSTSASISTPSISSQSTPSDLQASLIFHLKDYWSDFPFANGRLAPRPDPDYNPNPNPDPNDSRIGFDQTTVEEAGCGSNSGFGGMGLDPLTELGKVPTYLRRLLMGGGEEEDV